jgi:hypothetical protein
MCGETKPEADFAFADMAKGTRQRHCRKCQAAYRRAHYLANREEYIRREVARVAHYRVENRALLIAYLFAHPCVECGSTDPVMLDFDHRDPSMKKGNVTELAMRKPWRLVLEEIAKCDVRCANCHLRRTALQFGWRKVSARVPTEGAWLARKLPTDDALPLQLVVTVDTKRCTGCGLERPIGEFPIKNKKSGRRSTRCRACRSAYGKLHYQKNRDRYCARPRAPRHEQREPYWAWVMTFLASHPCIDCGETDPIVLQFDHRDGTTKVDAVGTMLNRASWGALLSEIAKCDVRCANCHRLRTARQFDWTKWIRESA